ncbi:hypothetical protein [Streptomyces sp. NPDC001068]|uniref:hypothetical protein n=1 Tax=Streptomyces sp. NPDC001068 TaxID=3364544 RepID=UPI0036BE5623
METFVTVTVTVIVVLVMVAVGVLLIHLLNDRHDDRIRDFPCGRAQAAVLEPAPSAQQKAGGRAGTNGIGDHRDGGRGRLRPWRRTRAQGK